MAERLELLRRFVEENPDDPFPRYGLAMEYRRLGETEEALATFRALRRDFPDYLPQYLMHGQLLAAEGRVDEAREVFRAGIALAKQQGETHALSELTDALEAL